MQSQFHSSAMSLSPSMNLRPYQADAVRRVIASIDSDPILVLPAGGGKTVTATEVVKQLGVPTLWVAHRRELIHQAADTLRGYGLDVGIIMAGEQERAARVQVSSVQTLIRNLDRCPPVLLVVVDECHHIRGTSYQRIIDRCSQASVLGLTATPFRLDGKGLGQVFSKIIDGQRVTELIRDGHLIEPTVYAPDDPDLSGVKTARGEYATSGSHRVMSGQITGNVVKEWVKHSNGGTRRTVVFAVNIKHGEELLNRFQQAGAAVEMLTGTTPKPERDRVMGQFRDGSVRVLVNVGILGEGVDVPSIEIVSLARPTASLCLHIQMIGRGMRPSPGKKNFIVLDHAGNHLRHGRVTDRLAYSLEGKAALSVTAIPSIGRRCLNCYLLSRPGLTECPSCGSEFPPQKTPREIMGELKRLGHRPSIAEQQEIWDYIRANNGYNQAHSRFLFKKQVGFFPLLSGERIIRPEDNPESKMDAEYKRLEAMRIRQGFKPGWTGFRMKAKFGDKAWSFVARARARACGGTG